LRAAFRAGESLREDGQEETSAVDVSGQHLVACVKFHANDQWDLVKRCDQPGKVLIQLESLILAQSERWRQA